MATWCGEVKYIRNGNKKTWMSMSRCSGLRVMRLPSGVSIVHDSALLLIRSLIQTWLNVKLNMLEIDIFAISPLITPVSAQLKEKKGPGKPFPIAYPGAGWDVSATFARTLAGFAGPQDMDPGSINAKQLVVASRFCFTSGSTMNLRMIGIKIWHDMNKNSLFIFWPFKMHLELS